MGQVAHTGSMELIDDMIAPASGDARHIGVFDSGVGGISVLKALVAELPGEEFRYFGDSANAPYGSRTEAEVLDLTTEAIERMLAEGAKAVVIACNTATSVAARSLREAHPDVPIVGIEPALKPAALAATGGRVLVMATPITLRLDKYHELAAAYGGNCEVISVPCPALAGRIEQGRLGDPDLVEMIDGYVGAYRGSVDGVVLGCTHYPFVREQIRQVLGDVPFFDGGPGTARQLRHRLEEQGLLAPVCAEGSVGLASSLDTPEELALYRWFFSLPL